MTGRLTATHGFAGEERWGYSQAVVAAGLVHASGQVPRADGEKPFVGPLPESFDNAAGLLESALSQVGSLADDLVHVQFFLFERDLAEGTRLYRERFGGAGSALSLVVVDGLNHPDYALEISAVAVARPSEGSEMRLDKRSINTGSPIDKQFGRATAVRVGDLIYVSGQPSVEPDGTAVADPSFVAHYRRAFANFVAAVEAAGGKATDVVSTHTFVTEPAPVDALATVAEIHREAVGSGESKPASTLVRVSALSIPGAKVEVTGVAVVGSPQ